MVIIEGSTPTGGTCPNDFSDPIGQDIHTQCALSCFELENSGIRVAVGECSVTGRRQWRPPYQTGKTVHVHAKILQTRRRQTQAPVVRGHGSVPLSHSGNVVTRRRLQQVVIITVVKLLKAHFIYVYSLPLFCDDGPN